jgi:queuine tRNA-ribosyltransferase
MQWDRAILTDSGGFQVWSLSKLRKVRKRGWCFQSHLNGDRHLFTPESVVDVQRALGSDIMMVLDECTDYPATEKDARRSMELTVRWARRAFEHYRAQGGEAEARQALFPIVQGSMYAELRRECAAQLVELDADGYAIGGFERGRTAASEPGDDRSGGAAAAPRTATLRDGRGDAGGVARVCRARD